VEVGADWSGTTAATGSDGVHYMCCKGALYANDVAAGSFSQLGDSTGWTSTLLTGRQGALYSLEQDGSLWEIGV
jgi:hypothetical protein